MSSPPLPSQGMIDRPDRDGSCAGGPSWDPGIGAGRRWAMPMERTIRRGESVRWLLTRNGRPIARGTRKGSDRLHILLLRIRVALIHALGDIAVPGALEQAVDVVEFADDRF